MTLPLLRLLALSHRHPLPEPCRGCVAAAWAGCRGCERYVNDLPPRTE